MQIWRKKTIKISLKILNKPVDNKKKTLNILHKTPLLMFYNCANILTTQQGLPYKSLQSTLYFTVLCDLCKHMLYFTVLCDLCKHCYVLLYSVTSVSTRYILMYSVTSVSTCYILLYSVTSVSTCYIL